MDLSGNNDESYHNRNICQNSRDDLPPFAPQNLALCTAALMYILSRDRLNMDLDRACLELMIKLLEVEHEQVTPEPPGVPQPAPQDQLTAKEVAKVKEKIRKLCETVHNKHLDLENITVRVPPQGP